MKLVKRSCWTVLLIAAAVGAAPELRASPIETTLDNPFVIAQKGDAVLFDATLSLPGGSGAAVFLNGDGSYVDSPLILNDDGFFNNFPTSLNPGDSVHATLFTITVPAGTLDGLYTGSFQILGGTDGSAGDEIANLAFNVQVGQTVPEPGGLGLAGLGLILILTMSAEHHL